jgi:hypothetical protein
MITSGNIACFSCLYRPGATKAQTWYKINGTDIVIALIKHNFMGIKKGAVILVAIKLPPSGNFFDRGSAIISYNWSDIRKKRINAMLTIIKHRIILVLSSVRCLIIFGCFI